MDFSGVGLCHLSKIIFLLLQFLEYQTESNVLMINNTKNTYLFSIVYYISEMIVNISSYKLKIWRFFYVFAHKSFTSFHQKCSDQCFCYWNLLICILSYWKHKKCKKLHPLLHFFHPWIATFTNFGKTAFIIHMVPDFQMVNMDLYSI